MNNVTKLSIFFVYSFLKSILFLIDNLINFTLRHRTSQEETKGKSLLPHLGDTLKPFSSLFSYTILNCINTLETHIIQGYDIAESTSNQNAIKEKSIDAVCQKTIPNDPNYNRYKNHWVIVQTNIYSNLTLKSKVFYEMRMQ